MPRGKFVFNQSEAEKQQVWNFCNDTVTKIEIQISYVAVSAMRQMAGRNGQVLLSMNG